MEWRQRIGRIGLKAEHLLSSAGPLGPNGVILIRTEGAGDHAAVPKTMKDRARFIELYATDDVGMMTYDHVCSRIDRCVCDFALVRRELGGHVNDAFV